MRGRLLLGAVVTLAVLWAGAIAVGAGDRSELAEVRRATAGYHDHGAAVSAGYGLLTDAAGISCIDQAGAGGMGIHYVNGPLVGDPALDPARPEALVYEPQPNGRLRLVAVEYVVFQEAWHQSHLEPPTLFGEEFTPVPAGNRYGLPPFYALHAWLWEHNPGDMFDDWNPRVTCPS